MATVSEHRMRRSPRVAHNGLAEGGVLLHLDTGAYHGLNELGWTIWVLLDREPTVGEIVAELRGCLDDPPPELGEDVARFLDLMRERDLVE